MNFLNVGPWELAVILIIAILLVGPKRTIEIAQAIRRFSGQLRSMSSEFTSLIQAGIQTSEREASQALDDMTSDKPAPTAGSQDEPQDAERETSESLADIIKEGLTPIAGIRAELQATERETRQALEDITTNIVRDERGAKEGQNEESG